MYIVATYIHTCSYSENCEYIHNLHVRGQHLHFQYNYRSPIMAKWFKSYFLDNNLNNLHVHVYTLYMLNIHVHCVSTVHCSDEGSDHGFTWTSSTATCNLPNLIYCYVFYYYYVLIFPQICY